MRPILIDLPGGIPIYAYGSMIALGGFLAIYIGIRRSRDGNISADYLMDLGLFGIVAGVLGARVVHVLEHWGSYFGQNAGREWYQVFAIWEGGLVFYGGAIGGMIYWIWSLWRRKLKLGEALTVMDLGGSLIPLGLAFGRMGCWFNGCCHGAVCHVPWAVHFPGPEALPPEGSQAFKVHVGQQLLTSDAAQSLAIHPSQLYAWANAFLLFLILGWVWRRRPWPGIVVGLWLTLYAGLRYLEEVSRGDIVAIAGGFRLSQWIAIGTALLGITWLVVTRQLYRCGITAVGPAVAPGDSQAGLQAPADKTEES